MRILIPLIIVLALLLASCSTETKTSKVVEVQKPAVQAESPGAQKIACYSDADCGVRRAENTYCFQDNPVGDLYEWRCSNPGTAQASCEELHKKGPIASCGDTYFCYKGECVKYADCNDSDGLDYEVQGKVTTNDFAVKEDYCKNSGELAEYYCSSDERAFVQTKACKCEHGACIG